MDFQPRFKNLQRDIERYLTAIGKREKNEHGQIVFRGYDDALKKMSELYLEKEAFEPLVSHFRRWNWELSYNDFLMQLSDALLHRKNWSELQRLWDGVISKRKKYYNDVWKIEKEKSGTLPEKTTRETKERLLETLQRVINYAESIGVADDLEIYREMAKKVNMGQRA